LCRFGICCSGRRVGEREKKGQSGGKRIVSFFFRVIKTKQAWLNIVEKGEEHPKNVANIRVCFKNSNIGKTFENDMENDHQRMVNSIFTLLSSESNCSVLFLKGSYFAAQFFFV